jgi:hypothetical protein
MDFLGGALAEGNVSSTSVRTGYGNSVPGDKSPGTNGSSDGISRTSCRQYEAVLFCAVGGVSGLSTGFME